MTRKNMFGMQSDLVDRSSITPAQNWQIKRRALPAALFLFTASIAAACSGRETTTATSSASPITARIAWLTSPSVLALSKFNGEIEKALAEKQIKVVWEGPFPAFSPVVEAINANSIDFTVGSSTSAASAMAGDAPLKIFAYQKNVGIGEGIVAQGNSSIRSVQDLIGKKVAVNRGGTGEYLLVKALEQENIPLEQVERVYLGPRDAAPAFAQGQVDAWAVWGIFLATAEVEHGGRIIATGKQIGSENDSIFAVRNEFLDRHPDVVKAVFEVLRTQSEWADKNRAAAVEVYAKEFELSDGVKKALENRFDGVVEPVGTAETDRIGEVANWFFTKGVIPKQPDASAFTVDITKL